MFRAFCVHGDFESRRYVVRHLCARNCGHDLLSFGGRVSGSAREVDFVGRVPGGEGFNRSDSFRPPVVSIQAYS